MKDKILAKEETAAYISSMNRIISSNYMKIVTDILKDREFIQNMSRLIGEAGLKGKGLVIDFIFEVVNILRQG